MAEKVAPLQEFAKQITPDKLGLVVMLSPRRIGAMAFITFLEYRHFPPGTPANEEFQMGMINWEDMQWGILVIPGHKRPLAEGVAKELGLRFADGVPTVVDHQGLKHFPIQLPNVFNVENVPGHFVYRNDPTQQKTAYQFEDEAIEREWNKIKPRAA